MKGRGKEREKKLQKEEGRKEGGMNRGVRPEGGRR